MDYFLDNDISITFAIISGISIIFWFILTPKTDNRFKSGFKNNESAPGCLLPLIGISTGFLSYFTYGMDQKKLYEQILDILFYLSIIYIIFFLIRIWIFTNQKY